MLSDIAIERQLTRLETACSINRGPEDRLPLFLFISLISFFRNYWMFRFLTPKYAK